MVVKAAVWLCVLAFPRRNSAGRNGISLKSAIRRTGTGDRKTDNFVQVEFGRRTASSDSSNPGSLWPVSHANRIRIAVHSENSTTCLSRLRDTSTFVRSKMSTKLSNLNMYWGFFHYYPLFYFSALGTTLSVSLKNTAFLKRIGMLKMTLVNRTVL